MTANVQRRDHTPPPPLEEGYWAALLHEGEFAETVPVEDQHHSQSSEATEDYIPPMSVEPQGSDWDEVRRIMQDDEVIDLLVSGYNRGGLLVEWRSLRGFVPASQLLDFPATSNDLARRKTLLNRVGQQLVLRVIELNEEQNRFILSERAAKAERGERADILARLSTGDSISGKVTNLCDFGAFVDLGGLEGLIHISELSWGRVGHPADILERGQEVTAYVLEGTAPPAGMRILQLPPEYSGLQVLTPELIARATADGFPIWVWPNDRALENYDAYLAFLEQGIMGLNINFPAQGVQAVEAFVSSQ